MTFSVIQVGVESETVVGTIWAGAETEAQAIMTDLRIAPDEENVVIRRSEDREVPLRPFD